VSVMGLLGMLRGAPVPLSTPGAPRPQIASPFTDRSALETIVWADLFGVDTIPPTRAEALSVPAVWRGRNIVATTVARSPLVVYRADVEVVPQPTWTQRTDGLSSPFSRMLWTVDDLVFYGESLWLVTRGAEDAVLTAERVPYGDWELDEHRRILVNGAPVPAGRAVYIPGPHEGILAYNGRAIRSAALLERSALDTAMTPFKLELHQTNDATMTDAEIDALVSRARTALASHGGILWTNQALEAKVHPVDSSQLLIEGRNAAVDAARLVGVPAATVDANTAGASLTYETSQGRNAEAYDYGFAAYMAAIAARLGMDDVVPRGCRTAFDLQELVGPAISLTGPVTED
jgi:hypothetical protein